RIIAADQAGDDWLASRSIEQICRKSVSGASGFDRYASQPASTAISWLSGTADKAMIGSRLVQLDSRRPRDASKPSTRGIARSITTMFGPRSFAFSTAARPSAAVKTIHPFERRYSE